MPHLVLALRNRNLRREFNQHFMDLYSGWLGSWCRVHAELYAVIDSSPMLYHTY